MVQRTINKYRLYCESESAYKYVWSTSAPTGCPADSGHTIDSVSVTVVDTIRDNNVHVTGTWTDGNVFRDVSVTPENAMKVYIPKLGKESYENLVPRMGFRFDDEPHMSVCLSNVTGDGSISMSNGCAMIASGASNSSAELLSKTYVRGFPGQTAVATFAVAFDESTAGNTQTVGLATDSNGFLFGYDGSNFGICKRLNGVDSWTYQNEWNTDPFDGSGSSGVTLNTSYGNVFAIKADPGGFGAICYEIQHPSTGEMICAHKDVNLNESVTPNVNMFSFPFSMKSINDTNNTSVVLKCASIASLTSEYPRNRNTHTVFNTKIVDSTQYTHIVSIRSQTRPCRLSDINVAVDGSKNVRVALYKNPTLSNSVFDNVDPESDMTYDTRSTLVSGEPFVSNLCSRNDCVKFPFIGIHNDMYPGETLTVAASLVGEGTSEISVVVNWEE